jgi:hypothetical protein
VLDGDAIAGSASIRVADATGIVPRGRYLMTRPDGAREWLVVVGIRERRLALKYRLIHNYAGAATIVGCRISIAVDPAWASAHANLSDAPGTGRGLARYVLRWTYTLGGHEMSALGFADLVGKRSEELVTPADVEARTPGWIASLPADHRANQGADFIAEAFRAVRTEAIGDEHAQRKIRDIQVLRELVHARAHVIRLEQDVMHGDGEPDALADAERRYRACYTRLVELPRAKQQVHGAPVRAALRRLPKLTRP